MRRDELVDRRVAAGQRRRRRARPGRPDDASINDSPSSCAAAISDVCSARCCKYAGSCSWRWRRSRCRPAARRSKPATDSTVLVGRGADAHRARSGAHHRLRVVGGDRADLRAPGPLQARTRPRSSRRSPSRGRSPPTAASGPFICARTCASTTARPSTPTRSSSRFDRQRDPHHPYHQADFTYWENNFRNIQRVEAVDPLHGAHHHRAPVRAVPRRTWRRSRSRSCRRRRCGSGAPSSRATRSAPGRSASSSGRRASASCSRPIRTTGAARRRFSTSCSSTIRDPRQRLVALEGGAIDVAENLSPEDLQFVALHPELTLIARRRQQRRLPGDEHARIRRSTTCACGARSTTPSTRPRSSSCIYQGLGAAGDVAAAAVDVGPRRRADATTTIAAMAMKLLAEAQLRRIRRSAPSSTSMDTPRAVHAGARDGGAHHPAQPPRRRAWTSRSSSTTSTRTCALTQNGVHDLCLLGWSADTDGPGQFLVRAVRSGERRAGRRAQPRLLQERRAARPACRGRRSRRDRAERERFYKKAQDLIAHEAPWVPIAHGEVVVAARASLTGLKVHPSGNVFFQSVAPEMSATRRRRAGAPPIACARGRSASSAICACATSSGSC